MFRLYLITDRLSLRGDLPGAVSAALGALPEGAAAVQLREKDLPGAALLELARVLAPICARRGAPLLVNDRADVAAAAGTGVHLPSSGLAPAEARSLLSPGALVGASCHSSAELDRAAGADFRVFGPVWETPGKGPPAGLEALAAAARLGPVYALGGATQANARQALRAGAAGVACIRAVLGADDPAQAARAMWAALEAAA